MFNLSNWGDNRDFGFTDRVDKLPLASQNSGALFLVINRQDEDETGIYESYDNAWVKRISSSGGGEGADAIVVSNVSGLASLTTYETGKSYEVLGGTSIGDGLGGFYYFDPLSTLKDNGLSIIKPSDISSSNPGRFILQQREIPRTYRNPKISNWLKNGFLNKKILLVGDSTSDQAGNASSIPAFLTKYTFTGEVLNGFVVDSTFFPNFGSNGNTIQGFFDNPAAPLNINAVIAANPDLIIFSYGINDVRQNQLTKDQLKNYIIACIDKLRSALPNCDFVLRMPNSFLTTDVGGANYVQQGSYPSLAAAAQAQSEILYNAYKELESYWPNVLLLNTQDLIFGRTSLATSRLMSDQIHPSGGGYEDIIDEVAKLIGYKAPFSIGLADNAVATSYSAPYNTYIRVGEDTRYFDLVTSGRYNAQDTTNRTFIEFTAPMEAYKIKNGDLVVISDTVAFRVPYNGTSIINQSNLLVRITGPNGTVPVNSITGGTVKVYRHKYLYDSNIETYVKNKIVYPYQKRVFIAGGGVGFLDFYALDNVRNTGENMNDDVAANRYTLTTSDIIIPEGIAPLTLSSTSFSPNAAGYMRCLKSGDYTSYVGKFAMIFGDHAYENPYQQNSIVLPALPTTLTLSNGEMGLQKGIMTVQEATGKKGLAGLVYINTTVPGANKISNTAVKTYFNTVFAVPVSSLQAGQLLTVGGRLIINSDAATPGTLTITLDLGSTVLLTTGAITLPAGLTNEGAEFTADVYIQTGGTNGIIEAQGSLNIGGIGYVDLRNTGTLSPINVTLAQNLQMSATFSVADTDNFAELRIYKVFPTAV